MSRTTATESTGAEASENAARSSAGGAPSLLARLLYGGVLAFMGVNHFQNVEQMAGYAESKGVPEGQGESSVLLSGGMLAFGGLGIITWRLPRLAAGAIISFLAATTPVMHDFWAVDEEQKQSEMNNFLKNVGLVGGALAFLWAADRSND